MPRTSAEGIARKITRKRPKLSCNQCRSSRRKCDREDPCSRCKQLQIDCTFDSSRQILTANGSSASHLNHLVSSVAHLPALSHTPESTESTSSRIWHDQSFISTVPSASTSLSTPSRYDLTTTGIDGNHTAATGKGFSHLNDLLYHRPFLSHCLEVYFTLQDSSTDLLRGTRLHRLSKNSHNVSLIDESTDAFDPIRTLCLSIVCLVAQMEPTSIQSSLILLPSPLRRRWPSAQEIEMVAYEELKQLLDRPAINPPKWTAEHFSASLLVKLYEKHAGMLDKCSDGVLVIAGRIQWAGLHRWPRILQSSSFIDVDKGYTSEQDRLLCYRVFWQTFDKERVSSWSNGWGYSIRPEQSNMCLRDAFGHATIQQLSRWDARDPLEYEERSTCSCLNTVDAPRLSAYAGIHARMGALCGRLYDRMGMIRDSNASLEEGVEAFVKVAANSLSLLESKAINCAQTDVNLMSRSQCDSILLIIAQLRCGIARRIFEVYATTLHNQGEARTKADGLIKRRELDAAIALIDKATTMTARADSTSLNRAIMPNFVHQQVMSLIRNLSPWFRWDPRRKAMLEGESGESKAYLIHCLSKALLGRNLLVLLARKNDLRYVQQVLDRTMIQLKDLFDKVLSPETIFRCCDSNTLVDETLIIEEMERYQFHLGFPAQRQLPTSNMDPQAAIPASEMSDQLLVNWDSIFPDPTPLLFSDEEMASFFADLPALEQLLQSAI